jgi:hypothetical protein
MTNRFTKSCPTPWADHDAVSFAYVAGTKAPAALATITMIAIGAVNPIQIRGTNRPAPVSNMFRSRH